MTLVALSPIGLNRADAAAYICASPFKFDALVQSGRMPSPILGGLRKIWEVAELDKALETSRPAMLPAVA